MDTSILVTLGLVAGTAGIVFLSSFLRRKGYVAPEDLVFSINVLKISSAVIDELNLKQEPQIKAITNLIVTYLVQKLLVMELPSFQMVQYLQELILQVRFINLQITGIVGL